jgi:acyl-CoA thioesterase FadM
MHYADTLPNDAKHLHTSRYTLRWRDMDAFGHVNNAMYFSCFEQVRVDWLSGLGIGHGTIVWFDHLAGHSVPIPKPVSRQLNHGD